MTLLRDTDNSSVRPLGSNAFKKMGEGFKGPWSSHMPLIWVKGGKKMVDGSLLIDFGAGVPKSSRGERSIIPCKLNNWELT